MDIKDASKKDGSQPSSEDKFTFDVDHQGHFGPIMHEGKIYDTESHEKAIALERDERDSLPEIHQCDDFGCCPAPVDWDAIHRANAQRLADDVDKIVAMNIINSVHEIDGRRRIPVDKVVTNVSHELRFAREEAYGQEPAEGFRDFNRMSLPLHPVVQVNVCKVFVNGIEIDRGPEFDSFDQFQQLVLDGMKEDIEESVRESEERIMNSVVLGDDFSTSEDQDQEILTEEDQDIENECNRRKSDRPEDHWETDYDY